MLRLALRQAGALTAIGLAAGCGIAVLFGWLLASALFGLVELDAMTFVIAGLGLGVVSLGAAYLPARRTLRLDPATILRG
jgi:ABC-type antimicrobial peptide transport system permease subunit